MDDRIEPADDNPEWTAETTARARPAGQVVPAAAAAALSRATERVELSIDREVVRRYRDTGPGWQERINQALRKAVGL